jgi:hypothetical protein
METKKMTRWYSNGLTEEEAIRLEKVYAKIGNPIYGFDQDNMDLTLTFSLKLENGNGAMYSFTDPQDIKAILIETRAYQDVSRLNGKLVEVFKEGKLIRCLSVNENLI